MRKKKNKKAQGAIEFVMLVGFLLFVFVMILGIIQENVRKRNAEKEEIHVNEVASAVRDEISLAVKAMNGYTRNFTLPQDIVGKTYSVMIADDVVYVNTSKIATALTIARVDGQIQKGKNMIKKQRGIVCLNKERCGSCTDSDNKNYNIFGHVTLILSGQRFDDSCIDSFLLNETFCNNDNLASETFNCVVGCENGKCLNCKDSDKNSTYPDGKNYQEKGIVYTLTGTFTDACFRGLEEEVVENYCENDARKTLNFRCSNLGVGYKCIDGKCILESVPPPPPTPEE